MAKLEAIAELRDNMSKRLEKISALSETTESRVSALDREITELGRNDATAKLEAKMKVELGSIQRELKQTRNEAVETKLALDSLGRSGGGGIGGGGGFGTGGVGRLGGGLLGIGGLFGTPLVQGAAGLLGSAGGAIGQALPLAGAGLAAYGGVGGLYGAGALGGYAVGSQISGAMELAKYEREHPGKLTKSEKTKMGLLQGASSEEAISAAGNIEKLQKRYMKLFGEGERGHKQLDLVNDSLKWMNKDGLPMATRLWDSFFPVIDKNVRRLEDFFSSKEGKNDFQRWVDELAPAGDTVLKVLGGAGHLVAALAADFAPLERTLGGSLAGWLGDKAEWADSSRGIREVETFSQNAIPLVHALGDDVSALGDGIVQLGKGGSGSSATYILEHLAHSTIPAFVDYIDKATQYTPQFISILGKLTHAAGTFFGPGSGMDLAMNLLDNIATILEKLTNVAPGAVSVLSTVGSAVLLGRTAGGGRLGGGVTGGALGGMLMGPVGTIAGGVLGAGSLGGSRLLGGAETAAMGVGAVGSGGRLLSYGSRLGGALESGALRASYMLPGRAGAALLGGTDALLGGTAGASMAGMAGGSLLSAGLVGGGVYLGGHLLGSAIGGKTGERVSDTSTGAAIGAGIGTFIEPGLGTLIGGGLGALGGAAYGAFKGAPTPSSGPEGMFGPSGYGLLGNTQLAQRSLLHAARTGAPLFPKDGRVQRATGAEEQLNSEFAQHREALTPLLHEYGRLSKLIKESAGEEGKTNRLLDQRRGLIQSIVSENPLLGKIDRQTGAITGINKGLLRKIALGPAAGVPGGGITSALSAQAGLGKAMHAENFLREGLSNTNIGFGGRVQILSAARTGNVGALDTLGREFGASQLIGQFEQRMTHAGGSVMDFQRSLQLLSPQLKKFEGEAKEVSKVDLSKIFHGDDSGLPKKASLIERLTGSTDANERKRGKILAQNFTATVIDNLDLKGGQKRKARRHLYESLGLTATGGIPPINLLPQLGPHGKQAGPRQPLKDDGIAAIVGKKNYQGYLNALPGMAAHAARQDAKQNLANPLGDLGQTMVHGLKEAAGPAREAGGEVVGAFAEGAGGPRGRKQGAAASKDITTGLLFGASPGGLASKETHSAVTKAGESVSQQYAKGISAQIQPVQSAARKIVEGAFAPLNSISAGGGPAAPPVSGGGSPHGAGPSHRGGKPKSGHRMGGRVGGPSAGGSAAFRAGGRAGEAIGGNALGALRKRTAGMHPHQGGAVPQGGGLVTVDGKPVAGWIAKILLSARSHGVDFSVSSGYRTDAEQTAIYQSGVRPAAVPKSMGGSGSRHEGIKYPLGAVDISPGAEALAGWLSHTRYANTLIYAGSKDPVHFSHPTGGGYRGGGRVPGRFSGKDSVDARLSPEEFVVTGDGEGILERMTGVPNVLNHLESVQKPHFNWGGRAEERMPRIAPGRISSVRAHGGGGGPRVNLNFNGPVHVGGSNEDLDKFAKKLVKEFEQALRNLPEGADEMTHHSG